ncbi:MAG: hypothetical protein FJY34_03870 [Betaproteobacteria bacterium]|nr:hypothetical protein [Betaproteobacteria bacterium]
MNHERRKNHKLRALFDEACRRVAPCYDMPARGLPVEWLVFRAARAAYPQLSTLDLFQFSVASTRIHRSRQAELAGHLAC